MKKQLLNIEYYSFNKIAELDKALQNLVLASQNAMKNSYSPYSSFQVGSAVLLDNGKIIEGNNQENAAYPSGICAERVALFYTGAHFPNNKIVAIAVVANNKKANNFNDIVPPCGACRQVMVETENRQNSPFKIILTSNNGNGVLFESINNLLPFSFNVSNLLNI